MHTLLNTNETTDDVLFIQEPWFNHIRVMHCNLEIQGQDILGSAANPKWLLATHISLPLSKQKS
jgi:hypothetical protein